MAVIKEIVIDPAIEMLPMQENKSVVVIVQIDTNTVVCTDMRQQKVVNAWLDSYDNYCMP